MEQEKIRKVIGYAIEHPNSVVLVLSINYQATKELVQDFCEQVVAEDIPFQYNVSESLLTFGNGCRLIFRRPDRERLAGYKRGTVCFNHFLLPNNSILRYKFDNGDLLC